MEWGAHVKRTRLLALLCLAAAGLDARQACGQEATQARFTGIMDSVFGAGNWRMTGGYRTPERENQLRAEGALTVPLGVRSRHSLGSPDAPGAYDLVVRGLSPSAAAAKLREAKAPFATLFPEGAHGSQGPHLHVEPHAFDLRGGGRAAAPKFLWRVAEPTPAELELTALRREAGRGSATAQLATAQAYARGYGTPRDRVAAAYWARLAASNPTADSAAREAAEAAQSSLEREMTADELALSRRLSSQGAQQAHAVSECEGAAAEGAVVVLLGPGLERPGYSGGLAENCPAG